VRRPATSRTPLPVTLPDVAGYDRIMPFRNSNTSLARAALLPRACDNELTG
jgi:hypothetical protein